MGEITPFGEMFPLNTEEKMDKITASFDLLLHQAPMTIHDHLIHAVEAIDKVFYEGYAEKHPELVSAFITAAASDFNTSSTMKVIGDALERITEVLESK